MNALNIETFLAQFLCTRGNDLARFIRGIVQYLNLKKLPRIVQLADRAQQAFDHIDFVEDRQLHGHLWQLLKIPGRHRAALSVFQK